MVSRVRKRAGVAVSIKVRERDIPTCFYLNKERSPFFFLASFFLALVFFLASPGGSVVSYFVLFAGLCGGGSVLPVLVMLSSRNGLGG